MHSYPFSCFGCKGGQLHMHDDMQPDGSTAESRSYDEDEEGEL